MGMGKPWLGAYARGVPASLAYPEIPLDALLSETARRFPGRTATFFFGARRRYADLEAKASRFAAGLARIGVEPGERVALCLPNCPQYVVAFYGILRAGGTVVQVNPLLTEHELVATLTDSGARTVVVVDAVFPRLARVWERTPLERAVVTSLAAWVPAFLSLPVRLRTRPKERPVLPRRAAVWELERLLQEAGPRPPALRVDPREHVAVFQYTGGTTGLPKAAMLTHANLVANVHQIRAWVQDLPDGREVFLCAMPFFHSYGMTTGMNLAVLMAGSMVLVPRFDPAQVAALISRHRVTLFPGVPAMYGVVTQHAQRRGIDLSSLKVCVSGGASLPAAVARAFQEVTGATLVEGYGLSEASPVTHVNPIGGGEVRLGSIGLPLPDTEARIVDLETGERELPPGEAGELVVRGPQVMKGYWNRPAETAEVLRGGWLHTGDIAVADADGYFRIVDRKKDLIIAGGFKIYPREVEEVLYAHPKVLDAAVVGHRHELRGETARAYVVPRPGEPVTKGEILDFCRERLAPYKVPREIEFVAELPKSAIGKVLRRELREAAAGGGTGVDRYPPLDTG